MTNVGSSRNMNLCLSSSPTAQSLDPRHLHARGERAGALCLPADDLGGGRQRDGAQRDGGAQATEGERRATGAGAQQVLRALPAVT